MISLKGCEKSNQSHNLVIIGPVLISLQFLSTCSSNIEHWKILEAPRHDLNAGDYETLDEQQGNQVK